MGDISEIAPAIAGIFIPVAHAREQVWVLAPIAFAFALLGMGVAYFAAKARPARRR